MTGSSCPGLNNVHTCVLVAQLTRRVTLHAERVSQFVVVRLVSFVFYFIRLNNHLDPFYQDRFYWLPHGHIMLEYFENNLPAD